MSDDKTLDQLLGVMNETLETFASIPCTIGYSYIRFEVDGSVRPCCIAKYPIGHLSDQPDWRRIWRSSAYQSFRAKMWRIHRDRFHLTDPEFLFCQQCSHTVSNKANAAAMAKATANFEARPDDAL